MNGWPTSTGIGCPAKAFYVGYGIGPSVDDPMSAWQRTPCRFTLGFGRSEYLARTADFDPEPT